ncbi:GNAT family N-acetyltransferase [Hymenobacter crusticola]|uniref:N-acetyltransferase domain-containing protein n=1 Tax=Hymenobacter crusticola TaxID=1770526 RepID=A0A243WFK8_9BACT|nr:GNAT family N-acetyltransferase [Hymenobacter crusticola]OUJ74552.1 hypothetical protein BXP70_07160 [Hymenobacter crusticola]
MHFPYQDLPPSLRLRYELVDGSNVQAYLPLFAGDPSPFVDQRFKHQARLAVYAEELLTDLRHSCKRGACDWLVRRRTDLQPVGVVHLYNLSHEVIAGRIPYCAVGYALAAPFRRQGYGQEALNQLLTQAAQLFGRTEVRALSAVENLASQALLQRCGFTLLEERAAAYRRGAVRLWQRPLLSSDQEPSALRGAGK